MFASGRALTVPNVASPKGVRGGCLAEGCHPDMAHLSKVIHVVVVDVKSIPYASLQNWLRLCRKRPRTATSNRQLQLKGWAGTQVCSVDYRGEALIELNGSAYHLRPHPQPL